MEKKKKIRRRSAVTGRFVSQEEVKEHPETTVTETVHEKKEEEPVPPPDG